MGSEQFNHSSWLSVDARKRCDQIFRQNTRTNVSRACDHFSLIHAQARKLDRQRRLVSLVIRQTRHTQDLSHYALKLIIELHKSVLEQIWRTSTQKMVDLVVRKTTSEQSKLYLSIVHP